eukprot:TRINITY_DN280_c0_g1_i1.p1 TRINITY_DN280_c0_g1~~TRINITY_DN280_c0_g1_i1.p1  ORF type:complete len:128 (+),score=4.59 TRINITY_DN280_c0_g1_i1:45-386(+)
MASNNVSCVKLVGEQTERDWVRAIPQTLNGFNCAFDGCGHKYSGNSSKLRQHVLFVEGEVVGCMSASADVKIRARELEFLNKKKFPGRGTKRRADSHIRAHNHSSRLLCRQLL